MKKSDKLMISERLEWFMTSRSKEHELLSYISDNFVRSDFEDIERHCFAKGTTLSDENNISFFYRESGRNMSRDVGVTLLISVILGNVMQIITSHNNCSLHLGWNDDSLEDLSSNGDIGSEGAFLVDVVSFDSLLGSLEVESDVLVVSHSWWSLLSE